MTNIPNTNSIKSYVDRIETLNDQKKDISEDIKDIFNEAKSTGIDVKALKEVIKRRKKNRAEIDELDSLVELYETNI